MKLTALERAVREHAGQFVCERIHMPDETRIVEFAHAIITSPSPDAVPRIGRLDEFHETFGGVAFYFDKQSGDAAMYLAPPAEWAELHEGFSAWIESLDDVESDDLLPAWVDGCLVIGEQPNTGNYILMPTSGDVAGRVFLFDHDGFEFSEQARDLVGFVERLLDPDDRMLVGMASHMRFIKDDPAIQWWIREMRDNRGNVVCTSV